MFYSVPRTVLLYTVLYSVLSFSLDSFSFHGWNVWRPRELKGLSPNHTASKWWRNKWILGSLTWVSTCVIMGYVEGRLVMRVWHKMDKKESSCLKTQKLWMEASVRCQWEGSLRTGGCLSIQVLSGLQKDYD